MLTHFIDLSGRFSLRRTDPSDSHIHTFTRAEICPPPMDAWGCTETTAGYFKLFDWKHLKWNSYMETLRDKKMKEKTKVALLLRANRLHDWKQHTDLCWRTLTTRAGTSSWTLFNHFFSRGIARIVFSTDSLRVSISFRHRKGSTQLGWNVVLSPKGSIL